MNEELLKKNNSKSIEESNINKINQIYIESELIAQYIIEKLISLVLSDLFKKEIDKKIADYCCADLENMLNDIKDMEFINHDKDDLFKRNILIDKISKTPKKIGNKLKNFLFLNEKEQKILNKSQIIQGYKFIKDLDVNTSVNYSINIRPLLPIELQCFYNLDNEKKVMKILKRKNMFEVNENTKKSFDNNFSKRKKSNNEESFKINDNNEEIEKIEKIETLGMDNFKININQKNSNVIITSKMKPYNSWNIIPQPKHVTIDRYAATKIKIDNSNFKNNFDNNLENDINLELKINKQNNENKNPKNDKIKKMLKIRSFNFNSFQNNESPRKTKKLIIPLDLPSYNLEPEKSNRAEETEEIKNMRKFIETQLNKKKIEEIKEEKKKEQLKKEKNLLNKNKVYINKNVTVDSKGNLVLVKPIKIESLINEFKNMGSYSKDIGKIKDETYIKKNFKNVKIEKNNTEINFNNYEKTEKKRVNISINNNLKIKIDDKNNNTKNETNIKIPDKNGIKFASGSNFEIMNLECGVNLIEDKKKKSGGKDFFQKYGRCSFEIFQDQLNKTSLNNNLININVNNSDSDNDKHMKTEIGLPPLNIKKMKREKTEYNIKNTEPNVTNNILNLKTKNLKIALSNLDLINEKNIREINGKNLEKINLLKNNSIKNIKKDKKDFGEINIFNRTLMKNKLWGDPNESFQNLYMTNKYPVKPENTFLKREISQNELNHSPRRRLPPISSAVKLFEEQTNQYNNTNNKAKKKLKDIKNHNLSKDSLYENKSKYFISKTNEFNNNIE